MKVKFFRKNGEESGVREIPLLSDAVLRPNMDGLKIALVAYQNNFRQGNAQAKNRAEVSGSGKKPYRQKGTGLARHGEKRSPIWSGGGVTFGPRKRDYCVKINRKLRRLALLQSLSLSAQEDSLAVVERFETSTKKTKDFVTLLKKFGDPQDPILLVDEVFEPDVVLVARNIPHVFMVNVRSLSAWEVVCSKRLIVTERGMEALANRLTSGLKGGS
jgi:large subunit ribosomal protein L4